MLIERRHEDDVRARAVIEQASGDLEPGQPGHLHVEKHEFGLEAADGIERLDSVAGLADELDAPDLTEQVDHLVPRELFVVDEHGAQLLRHAVTRSCAMSSGMSRLAQVPLPGTLVSFRR